MAQLAKPDSYEHLEPGKFSAGPVLDVLQLTLKEKDDVTSEILTELARHGITEGDMLGSGVAKGAITRIITTLKISSHAHPCFTRALQKGEGEVSVDKAMVCLIKLIHNQRKKRAKLAAGTARQQARALGIQTAPAQSLFPTHAQPYKMVDWSGLTMTLNSTEVICDRQAVFAAVCKKGVGAIELKGLKLTEPRPCTAQRSTRWVTFSLDQVVILLIDDARSDHTREECLNA
jgi:hypothetical protein